MDLMDFYGLLRTFMDFYGPFWIFMDLYGLFKGLLWIVMDFYVLAGIDGHFDVDSTQATALCTCSVFEPIDTVSTD
jgi:hypothetical protein